LLFLFWVSCTCSLHSEGSPFYGRPRKRRQLASSRQTKSSKAPARKQRFLRNQTSTRLHSAGTAEQSDARFTSETRMRDWLAGTFVQTAFLSNLFHDEPGFSDPVINMAIIRCGMKSFRDNSISARVLICVRQPLSAVSPDGACWRSCAVTPLYGIAAAHPFVVLAFAEFRQIFRTSDPHGAGRVARHYRKFSSLCGNRGRYRKQRQQGECELD
jgi:hypothetical protein